MVRSRKKAYKGNKNDYVDKNGRVRRVRKVVPKFDALFIPNTNVFEDSIDVFKLPNKRKCKKIDDKSLSSGNDTFDCFLKASKAVRPAISTVVQCSNSKLTSSEYDSSNSSIHFLSPLAPSKENQVHLSKLKYRSPDLFSDTPLTMNFSKRKEHSSKQTTVDNVIVRLSPLKINLSHHSRILLPLNKNGSTGSSTISDRIFTSTPAVSRKSHSSCLTRLKDISPLQKEFYSNLDGEKYCDSNGFIQNTTPNFSSVSVRGGYTMTTNNVEKNDSFIQSSHKPLLSETNYSTLQHRSGVLHKKSCADSMIYKMFNKENTRNRREDKKTISGIEANFYQNLSMNNDGKPSISLCLSHAKDWKRTLRKTVNQLSESCLKVKAETADTGEVEHLYSRSFLEALPLNLEKSDIEENEEILFLGLCNQVKPLPLSKFFPKSTVKLGKKIGEGIYGEVFAMKSNKASADLVVVKLIPIEGAFKVNEEPQKTFKEITSELVVSQALSKLMEGTDSYCQNFPCLVHAKCLQGKYTTDLIKLWDQYHSKLGSENDRPTIFPKDQLYLLLEFNHVGENLETYQFSNAMQGYSIFLQVAYALAAAEECFQFEHRDLHWGNILIKATEQTYITYRINGKEYKVESRHLKATIIDFTLSRLQDKNNVIFNDLSKDPTLFIAKGDYQFEIYRQMKILNKNQWANFNPKTNIFWLHYLVMKITSECNYKNKSSKTHKKFMALLRQTTKQMLSFESAHEFVIKIEKS